MVLAFVSLAFGTFVSEDVACIAAGLLIERGDISAITGVVACTLGIFLGDLGLWALGRLFGRGVLTWPRVSCHLRHARFAELRCWLERRAAGAIVASRFLPGTRLPIYLIAGILELPARIFVKWALLATLLWTPALVLMTARLGATIVSRVSPRAGFNWIGDVLVAGAMLALLRITRRRRMVGGAARGMPPPLDVLGIG